MDMIREYLPSSSPSPCPIPTPHPCHSGVGGGVVAQDYFKSHFGITDANGHTDPKKSDNVSSNVVSVLQAGAFFGALGSAPLSGVWPFHRLGSARHSVLRVSHPAPSV